MNSSILLVEDDEALLEYTKLILKNNEYEVITAKNGVEALEILEIAVKNYPKFAPLYDDLAKIYVLSHDYEKALDAYHKVIELAPDSAMAKEAENAARRIKRY